MSPIVGTSMRLQRRIQKNFHLPKAHPEPSSPKTVNPFKAGNPGGICIEVGQGVNSRSIQRQPCAVGDNWPAELDPDFFLNNFYLVIGLAKQLDMTERQVERWWRMRRSQDKPSTLVKFCENSWRCIFYLYNFSYGLFVLWDKEWMWDIDQCYVGYPYHGITNDIWWYYMISTAFYWSLTISQFWDVRRKDFWQMFVHHITTIALLSFSWVCNLHRIGTLVLLVHDCADILLDAAKATKYANYQKLCDTLFAVFTLLWIVTRLGIFPFYIIWSTSIRAPMLQPMFPAYYIFNTLLCLMLGLHLVWTWLILQVAYKAITAGKLDGDIRSSSSELSDSSHQSNHSTPSRAHAHAHTNSNAHAHSNSNAHAHVNNHKDK
ncbi:LAG1 longevity assurance-like 6 [Papilio xuthus]|uniref:LAG1 longevity assurance-like 6 n=1 Tax=Papilio xuthus TaxID=66420 RepID=A0A194Q246_PAPXU|nr:LAG1 longevity assurance-like 6 [Papilio xuthus]